MTLPTRRQRIERVLAQHAGKYPSAAAWRVAIIDALCALFPEPNREALNKILERLNHGLVDPTIFEGIKQEVMAWATDVPTSKVWCEHMRWQEDEAHLLGWYYAPFPQLEFARDWARCPVKGCEALRPTDP